MTELQDDYQPAKYRNSHCTECERTLPVNRLIKVKVKELNGSSSGSSRSIPSFTDLAAGRRYRGSSTRVSSRTYYRYVNKRMCQDCYAVYEERQRRAFIIKAAIVIFVVFFFALQPILNPRSSTVQTAAPKPQSHPTDQAYSPPRLQPSPMATSGTSSSIGSLENSLVSPPSMVLQPFEPAALPKETVITSSNVAADPRAQEPTTIVKYLANVRATPTTSGAIRDEADVGERLTIVEARSAWMLVRRHDTIIGWIHKSNLSAPVENRPQSKNSR